MIEELFEAFAAAVALATEAAVVVIIAFASAKAFIKCVPLLFSDDLMKEDRRQIWMRYATAIILALEFSLAGDIIRSAIAPTWEALGKLAAIAAIRTALNFFLARDIETIAEAGRRNAEAPRRD